MEVRLEDSLAESLTTHGSTIGLDLAEVGLDQLLQDGPIRDIPIVGALVNIWKAGVGVREILFAKKILLFLKELDTISQEERASFKKKFESDSSEKQKLVEHLILILERSDDLAKSELFARAFIAYSAEKIDYLGLRELFLAIDRCFIPDLNKLRYLGAELESTVGVRLASAGIVEATGRSKKEGSTRVLFYKATRVGQMMCNHVIVWPSRPGS